MNEYADTKWQAGQFVVRVEHGSGDGRSYGKAEIICNPALWPDWANSDQTTDYNIFDSADDTQAAVDAANEYYDGSDYR